MNCDLFNDDWFLEQLNACELLIQEDFSPTTVFSSVCAPYINVDCQLVEYEIYVGDETYPHDGLIPTYYQYLPNSDVINNIFTKFSMETNHNEMVNNDNMKNIFDEIWLGDQGGGVHSFFRSDP